MSSILVVEDEVDTRTVLQLLLAMEGFDVRTAGDGIAALESVGEEAPDLVITDWMMPRMSGVELCRRLRQDPATRDIPIIVASARGREPAEDGLYERFLHKPYEIEDLVETVRRLLPGSGSGPG